MSRRPAQHPYDFIREPFSASDLGIRAVTRLVPNRTHGTSQIFCEKSSYVRVSVPFVSLIASPSCDDQYRTGVSVWRPKNQRIRSQEFVRSKV